MRKIVDGIVQDAKFGMETIKAYVTKADKKKVFLQTLPYIIMAYLCDKVSWLVRSAWGRSVFEKFTFIMNGLNNMFVNPQPSFQKQDVVNGIIGGMMFYLVVTYRRKHAKKFRHGMEYGSARWGNEKDMKPYMDPVFENNIILTQTERLMMSGRPKNPKYARNKNILVIGGSGSGKTRFFVKPNLMQMHCSYVITDPKGSARRSHLKRVGTT